MFNSDEFDPDVAESIDVPQDDMIIHGSYQEGEGIYWHEEHGLEPLTLTPIPGDVVEHDGRRWYVVEYVTYLRLVPYPETPLPVEPANSREYSLDSSAGDAWGIADWMEVHSGRQE